MILKQLAFWLLEWGAGKLASWLKRRADDARIAEERAHQAKQELERLKKAKTEKEVEDAAKDTLGL